MNRESVWYKLSCIAFPERCAVCNAVIEPNQRYCSACSRAELRVEAPRCFNCGSGKKQCSCHRRRRHYDAVLSVFYYKDRVKACFPAFKKREHYGAAECFAAEMAGLVREQAWQVDCITFAPSHPAALRERGFNPAELLATALGKELALPVKPLLQKLYDTQPQKELPRMARSGNLLGAFDVTGSVDGIHRVLLVDDVITTGSTLDECAKMLKLYGVDTVYAVTVCCTC